LEQVVIDLVHFLDVDPDVLTDSAELNCDLFGRG
jgi:hypothetical protein